MKDNPYRADVIAACVLSAVILPLEAWRRRDELLSPSALDDAFLIVAALIGMSLLVRRRPAGPAFWLFVCGGAWFMALLSLWSSIYFAAEGDPSGAPAWAAIAFKGVLLALITLGSWRAFRRVRLPAPYASHGGR